MSEAPETELPRPLWVFGYASLLWNPGFPVAEERRAVLHGYHRSFCMWSVTHRGSHDAPGLVLALDKAEGHTCTGLAFRVPEDEADAAIGYLRERELVTSAYRETPVALALEDGSAVTAIAYVIDPDHAQYVRTLSLEEQAQIIARSRGGRGPNTEYLWNTFAHLDEMGITDPDLAWLDARVREITRENA